jgi:hypothetical protein
MVVLNGGIEWKRTASTCGIGIESIATLFLEEISDLLNQRDRTMNFVDQCSPGSAAHASYWDRNVDKPNYELGNAQRMGTFNADPE